MKAWHFVRNKLRDGRPIPDDGVKLVHEGHIQLCESGLHASKRLIDALKYGPGNTICRVECGGDVAIGDDKLVCTERTILWRIDATELLRRFARQCALDVSHRWDMPEVVERWLVTGEESIRRAAFWAAFSADRSAAYAAAYSTVYLIDASVTYCAARYAAFSATCSAKQNKRLTRWVTNAHRTGDWR